MRKIKFRGLFTDENDYRYWVFGQLVNDNDTYWIVGDVIEANEEYINVEYWYPVDAKTVGQYTGLKDKNDVEIYEGDIVKYDDILHEGEGKVAFTDFGSFVAVDNRVGKYLYENFRVIGNIYENKDLIENET